MTKKDQVTEWLNEIQDNYVHDKVKIINDSDSTGFNIFTDEHIYFIVCPERRDYSKDQ